ncbi:MAG: hypothetical protein OEU32_15365, partial [Acidimicrobiia bacterium]|nr:hypothetical protein [Acidimicrobiia bacterium]
MDTNKTAKAARKAGEEFLAETRDGLNSLLKEIRSKSGSSLDQVADDLRGMLDRTRVEGEKVISRLRGNVAPAKKAPAKKKA